MEAKHKKEIEAYKARIQKYKAALSKRDDTVASLTKRINELEFEKLEMTESFAISTNVLIERLKDLEAKNMGFRPQTACVLDKIGKETSLSPPRFQHPR